MTLTDTTPKAVCTHAPLAPACPRPLAWSPLLSAGPALRHWGPALLNNGDAHLVVHTLRGHALVVGQSGDLSALRGLHPAAAEGHFLKAIRLPHIRTAGQSWGHTDTRARRHQWEVCLALTPPGSTQPPPPRAGNMSSMAAVLARGTGQDLRDPPTLCHHWPPRTTREPCSQRWEPSAQRGSTCTGCSHLWALTPGSLTCF